MPSIDLPLQDLQRYTPSTTPPEGFDRFWDATVDEALASPASLDLEVAGPRLVGVRVQAASFEGFGGGRVTGWYLQPEGEGPFPGVVAYHGYSGQGARPLESYALAAQGVAVLSMDCRGQSGDSPGIASASGHTAGWLTQGLDAPQHHYYRTVYGDAVRAAEALCARPEVDSSRVAFTGASQGGGLTLAAAALSSRPCFAWSDVPFLCDFPRAVAVATTDPYLEIPRLIRRRPELEETAFATLAYVDVANLAHRVTCPVVVTVALWDETCPPSTVFGAYSRLGSLDKTLRVHPFQGHALPYATEEERLAGLLERLGVAKG